MISPKIELNVKTAETRVATATEPKATGYRAPELFPVGKAIDLVQGGGGSSADNNRARQY